MSSEIFCLFLLPLLFELYLILHLLTTLSKYHLCYSLVLSYCRKALYCSRRSAEDVSHSHSNTDRMSLLRTAPTYIRKKLSMSVTPPQKKRHSKRCLCDDHCSYLIILSTASSRLLANTSGSQSPALSPINTVLHPAT